MRVEQTPLEGCFLIHDSVFKDERGFFFESYNAQKFLSNTGLDIQFVQDNQSRSTKGSLRGLHFQTGNSAQAKLVRVLNGEVQDVAIDIRQDSPTYGKHFSVILSGSSNTQLFIPRGFAHGFLVLSDEADFFYKCDNYYNKQSEGGIIFSDADLGINWLLPPGQIILSSKDKELPLLQDQPNLF